MDSPCHPPRGALWFCVFLPRSLGTRPRRCPPAGLAPPLAHRMAVLCGLRRATGHAGPAQSRRPQPHTMRQSRSPHHRPPSLVPKRRRRQQPSTATLPVQRFRTVYDMWVHLSDQFFL
ncbi:hypothetical protein PVAP13_3NG275600 [Panicum virgatum]|uniref:Secreted protein n=1 Tax=Panicum virgatum TaxID=38727 RepID=A0A8T0UC48_PANVG|nr:hypothetical protein PVAP13_3NG275600 [Panicum virgatum]